jgi:hypothetical protein
MVGALVVPLVGAIEKQVGIHYDLAARADAERPFSTQRGRSESRSFVAIAQYGCRAMFFEFRVMVSPAWRPHDRNP